jgi:hypothetical protein
MTAPGERRADVASFLPRTRASIRGGEARVRHAAESLGDYGTL